MKGIWKNALSGYDRKGNRRKKQTRHHFVKDNAQLLRRRHHKFNHLSSDKFRIEGDTITVGTFAEMNGKIKVVQKTNVYKILVSFKCKKTKTFKSIKTLAYQKATSKIYSSVWFDYKTDKPLKKVIGINHYDIFYDVKILNFIEVKELDWERVVEKNKSIVTKENLYNRCTKEFIYGKIVYGHEINYSDGKRRKIAQKYINGITRASVRNWISKMDWDSERKTHPLEKSLAWEIS